MIESGERTSESAGARPARAVVLVVDDEVLTRAVAATALADAGYEVLEVDSGEEALAVLESHDDVVVLFSDINMGALDGLTLARIARRRRPHLRVVLTSGQTCPPAGDMPEAFLPKPYLTERVVQLIDRLAS